MTGSPFTAPLVSDIFGWQSLAVLAAVLSVLISVMLIMLARALDLRQLEQTAKKEFVFAASTVFIVLFVVLMLAAGDSVVVKIGERMYLNAVTYGISEGHDCPSFIPAKTCESLKAIQGFSSQKETLIDIMLLYMEAPADCTQSFLKSLYYASIPLEACASLFMEIFMSEHMSCFGLKWAAERITNTTQMMTFYMFAYYLLVHTLNFVKYYAGFFFAVGVVLRAIPPSRGMGAYLMAISVGLYFIFPFSYILVSSVSFSQSQSGFVTITGLNASGTGLETLCSTPTYSDVEGLQCGTESIAKQFELRAWLETNKISIFDFLGNLQGILLHLVSVICIFPLVAFVILFTFVLNTTNLFGGNIPEIGRGLVRLI